MELTKDDIKAWLKEHGNDRAWLGQQLGVTRKTVQNWLSTDRPIPTAKLRLIERLIQDEAADAAQEKQLNKVLLAEVDLPRFRRYAASALARKMTVEQWCIAELDAAAEKTYIALSGQPPPWLTPEDTNGSQEVQSKAS